VRKNVCGALLMLLGVRPRILLSHMYPIIEARLPALGLHGAVV
jgi:hypothetical protein